MLARIIGLPRSRKSRSLWFNIAKTAIQEIQLSTAIGSTSQARKIAPEIPSRKQRSKKRRKQTAYQLNEW